VLFDQGDVNISVFGIMGMQSWLKGRANGDVEEGEEKESL
jgi:hypothetical protein